MLTCIPLSDKVKDMCSYLQMKQIIDKPTRVTKHSCTCIDLILVPTDKNNIMADVRAWGLSDHSLMFIQLLSKPKPKCTPSIHKFRSFRHFKKEKYIEDGALINWDNFYKINDVEELWSLFRDCLLCLLFVFFHGALLRIVLFQY